MTHTEQFMTELILMHAALVIIFSQFKRSIMPHIWLSCYLRKFPVYQLTLSLTPRIYTNITLNNSWKTGKQDHLAFHFCAIKHEKCHCAKERIGHRERSYVGTIFIFSVTLGKYTFWDLTVLKQIFSELSLSLITPNTTKALRYERNHSLASKYEQKHKDDKSMTSDVRGYCYLSCINKVY